MEYDAGGWNSHSMNVMISNKYGAYGGQKQSPETNHWGSLGVDEALTPFLNSVDSGRVILARTHVGQKVPIENAEQALVETGAEYIVPQITSSKFIHLAKYDGEVIDVKEKESITVKYKSGRIETFDIQPRFSSTKRNSTIMISMNNLKVGTKFKKDQMVGWSRMFDGDRFVGGRNVTMAVMNYDGLSYEDGYVISEGMADKFVSETIKKITVMVPPDTKVLEFNGGMYSETNKGDVLIAFQFVDDISDYIEMSGLMDANPDMEAEEESMIFTKGKDALKTLSPGGEIVDIKIKINNPKLTDPALISEWKKLTKELKRKHKEVTKNAQSQKEQLSDNSDMSILKTGMHKAKGNFFEGALVEFYIKVPKTLQKGDKISNRFGAKGVCTHVMDKAETPKAEQSGDIDIFLPSCGILGRKGSAIIKELYVGKIMYNLQKQVQEKANGGETVENIRDFVEEVYNVLDPTKEKRLVASIREKMKIPAAELKKGLKEGTIKFNYMIPPFNTPGFKDFKEAAGLLNIELDEKVYIPKTDSWTKKKIPVGIAYYSQMEQYAEDYENTRSVAGYSSITGQPLKGAARGGGQSLGGLDLFALLSYDGGPILEELMVGRSDNIVVKRAMLNNLRMTGESDIIKDPRKGQTNQLMNTLFKGLGLDIQK
jgi:DNA-directed RNA polymerase beta subunit